MMTRNTLFAIEQEATVSLTQVSKVKTITCLFFRQTSPFVGSFAG